MTDKIFADGVHFSLPNEKAPDFVKGKLGIKMKDFIAFAKQHHKDGWVNLDLKVSKNGKAYAELDTWEPKEQVKDEVPRETSPDDFDDKDIPF